MKIASTVLASLFAATYVSAHATFQEFWIGSTDYAGQNVRLPGSNSPVTDVTANDVACNIPPNPAPTKLAVAAGATVTVEMHQQPGDRSCAVEAIGGAHYGPVLVYMAKVDDALSTPGYSANWFKVSQTGLISGTGAAGNAYWGSMQLNDNCGKYTFTIPSCIPPGDYLIRAEVIALHVAYSIGGAQLYMSCYAVTVTGGGSASPSTVKFPGAYSATDPGIYFDLYGGFTSYTIPGPSVFTCSGSTGSPSSSSNAISSSSTSSTRASSSSSSSRASSSSSSSSRTSSASGAGQTLYGQCGGTGWTGATTCAQGTCTYTNAYYSQCLP